MRRIELSRLTLTNFKGIRDLTVEFSDSTVIRGANGTGKTSVFDAFMYLLFGKDSQNKVDFGIKTMENGVVVPGVDHIVEAQLIVDGEAVSLRKVYAEVWMKKRGGNEQVFSGHSTDHFIDGVPTKQKDYQAFIDGLVDESLFKLLTNPLYFNESLKWEERRKILLEVCGDLTDAEVIASDDVLSALRDILGKRSIDDHRKVIAAERARINKELRDIPTRIDEANRSKPTGTADKDAAEAAADEARANVERLETRLTELQSGGEVAKLTTRIAEIDGEIAALNNSAQADAMAHLAELRKRVRAVQERVNALDDEMAAETRKLEKAQKDRAESIAEADGLRVQWAEINAEEFHSEINDNCPTCGQGLPEEQISTAHAKALADFNASKSRRLENVVEKGKAAKSKTLQLDAAILKIETAMRTLHDEWSQAVASLDQLQAQTTEAQRSVSEAAENAPLTAKQAERAAVSAELTQLRSSLGTQVADCRTQLMDARDAVRRAEKALAAWDAVAGIDARIEELKAQERMLAAEYERLEQELYLTEQFVRTKVSLLESRINSKFAHARFRMFAEQVNGGLADTCVTLYDGVPWGAGLNTGACIVVGLDIIATLQEHYGIYAPVFVDGRESLTSEIDMPCQVVELIADAGGKTLTVEHQGVTADLQAALF